MKKNATKFGKTFDLPNPGLRAYFESVVQGQPDEYRTPFYKGKSLNEILDGWAPTLEKLSKTMPTLMDFENDLRKKVGPMSIRKPLAERMDDIESYYRSIHLDRKPLSSKALAAAESEFASIRGLRMSSQEVTVDRMKKSTNSGCPYFTKRKRVVDKTLPVKLIGLDQIIGPQQRRWNQAAVLGWRGQEGGPDPDDVKQRVVWMFPFATNIEELRVYQPLISACQKRKLVPAWVSLEEVDNSVTRLFDSKARDDIVICTDFEKFDQHFNPALQECASQFLAHLFTDTGEFNWWLTNVYPVKYNIPLAYNWNCIKTGAHGMASGSGGTNADETLAHRVLQHEAAILSGKQLNPNSQCLGDDGILSYPGCTVEDVVSAYSSHGLVMNKDKQYASQLDCTYLRRYHHAEYRVNNVCVGVYSTYRALGRLAEQERYYSPEEWGPEMVCLRELSILENCKYHPLREQFAEYCMKGDKFRLGLDIPGFFDKLSDHYRRAIDHMPDFMGYARSLTSDGELHGKESGINTWWIVNYLKSHA